MEASEILAVMHINGRKMLYQLRMDKKDNDADVVVLNREQFSSLEKDSNQRATQDRKQRYQPDINQTATRQKATTATR